MERQTYSDLNRPSYNIKAVAQMVGLLPVTLRAWERRYGLPTPSRGGQGYRLYSEYDVQTLRWLKEQIENGMNIGQAARKLAQMRESGIDPAVQEHLPTEKPLSLENIRLTVSTSLRALNEKTATEAMRQAFSLYPVEQIFHQLIKPTMVEIGEMWHRKEIPVAVEHFASHFFQEQLLSLLNAAPEPYRNGFILAGCMPGEHHQLGLVMIVVLMRLRGWNVIYLGADLSLDRLEEVLSTLRPRLVLFSSTMPDTASNADKLHELIRRIPEPLPAVVLGGEGFRNYVPENSFPHTIILDEPDQIIHRIEFLLETKPR